MEITCSLLNLDLKHLGVCLPAGLLPCEPEWDVTTHAVESNILSGGRAMKWREPGPVSDLVE